MLVIICLSYLLIGSTIDPDLDARLPAFGDYEMLPIIVHMKDQTGLALSSGDLSREEKVSYLQEFSASHQTGILDYVKRFNGQISDLRTYWIFNGFALKATKHVIRQLSTHPDIDCIIGDGAVKLDDQRFDGPRNPEWNIIKIGADTCWDLGYDGSGIIVGTIDTGVDTSHPALSGKFVPGGWFDAVNGQGAPYDDNGHGTFSLGIICGGDGNGPFVDDIGVAPGVHYIAAKVFDAGGSGQLTWLHSGLQWMATQDVDIINNPWGIDHLSQEFWTDCLNLHNLGITVVFAVGGGGPGSGTAAAPGNYPVVTGVGATDNADDVSSFSARGPAPDQPPWNDTTYWQRPDWNLTKPDIVAPGVNVRSSYNNGTYSVMSGTSLATAHVTGAYAILLQMDSLATNYVLYQVLLDYADHPVQGEPYPNNDYGWGRVNVFAALQALSVAEYRRSPTSPSTLNIAPNPFFGKLVISYSIGQRPKRFELKIYDASGRLVKDLAQSVNNSFDPGRLRPEGQSPGNAVIWTGTDQNNRPVAAGAYFVELKADGVCAIKKALFIH